MITNLGRPAFPYGVSNIPLVSSVPHAGVQVPMFEEKLHSSGKVQIMLMSSLVVNVPATVAIFMFASCEAFHVMFADHTAECSWV